MCVRHDMCVCMYVYAAEANTKETFWRPTASHHRIGGRASRSVAALMIWYAIPRLRTVTFPKVCTSWPVVWWTPRGLVCVCVSACLLYYLPTYHTTWNLFCLDAQLLVCMPYAAPPLRAEHMWHSAFWCCCVALVVVQPVASQAPCKFLQRRRLLVSPLLPLASTKSPILGRGAPGCTRTYMRVQPRTTGCSGFSCSKRNVDSRMTHEYPNITRAYVFPVCLPFAWMFFCVGALPLAV